LSRKKGKIVDKERIDRFWKIGEALLEGGLLLTDLYVYFSGANRNRRNVNASKTKTPRILIDEKRRMEIKRFATQIVDGRYTVYDELPKMIAPYIAGNEELKLALCYSLASTPEKPVHLLIIGNPASVKSDLLHEVKEIFPEAVLGGPRSTEAGLTINSQDGSPGLLMLANDKIALIDEFDKIRKNEINATYQALESGVISVNTGKFKGQCATKFICVATANPKGGAFQEDPKSIRKQIEQVFPLPLLSRFHMIFLLRKEPSDRIKDAVTAILTRKDKMNPNKKFLRDYFIYIRQKCRNVEFTFSKNDPIVSEMTHFVVDALERGERGQICYGLTKRFAEALKRISISSARLRLSRKVEEIDVRNAMNILNFTLNSAAHHYMNETILRI